MKIGLGKKKDNQAYVPAGVKDREDSQQTDLSKLKKKDLLEIMLRQGEEIDTLRARVAELEAEINKREFELSQVGNIAEASLVVTKVFEEAQKAAVIYLKNVKRTAARLAEMPVECAADDQKGGRDE